MIMSSVQRGVAIATTAAVVVLGGTTAHNLSSPTAAAASTDALTWAQGQRDACKAALDHGGLLTVQKGRMLNCVADAQAEINALTITPTPTPTSTPPPSPTPGPTDSPPPSPTPAPSPTPPTPSPTATGFPGAADTGPATPPTAHSTGSGSGTSTTRKVFDGLIIDSTFITGSHVAFRNCLFPNGVIFSRGVDIIVDHCDILGGLSLSGTQDVTLTANDISRWDDAIHITSDSGPVKRITVDDNWAHDPALVCGGHMDAVQLLGVDTITIRHNTLDLGPWKQACGGDVLNGAFQIENTQGPDLNMNLVNNYLNGGGFTARFYQCASTSFTANVFGTDAHYGLATGTCASTWSGNVDAQGQLVPKPTS